MLLENRENMNTRTNLRRLRNLIYSFGGSTSFYDPKWMNHKDSSFRPQFYDIERQWNESLKYEWNCVSVHMNRQKQMWDLYCDLKLTPEQLYEIVVDVLTMRDQNRLQFVGRPPRNKKDNGQQKVGSGGSNRNKIRFPRKCRKTAWKRFYKLFPHLCTAST